MANDLAGPALKAVSQRPPLTAPADPAAHPRVPAPPTPPAPAGPADPEPPRTRRRWNPRKWRARLVVLLMLAGAVLAGQRLIASREGTLAQFDLGTVTLTADAIPVESRATGQVSQVSVHAQQQVRAGQRLGTLVVTTTTPAGRQVAQSVAVTAPAAGIVTTDPAPVGSIVQPGQPFAQMYDPGRLTLDAAVRVADLPQLSAGMTATLQAPGLLHPVRATVQRVVPRLDASGGTVREPTAQDRLVLVLVPEHPADLAQLVPGMHFTGSVDTRSAPAGAADGLHVDG